MPINAVLTLRRTLVCIKAARRLYTDHAAYYEIDAVPFDTLSPAVKARWVEAAQENIRAVGPPRPTMLTEYREGLRQAQGRF
jgi:hypothetical protein